MDIQLIKKPFDYIIIDDFYTAKEKKLVLEEILAVERHGTTAKKSGGHSTLKTGSGVFLDILFDKKREQSKILTANRKLFSDEVYTQAIKLNAFFGHLGTCDADSTLINYYNNNEYYGPHKDLTVLSAVTFFGIGSFTGGNFYFDEYDEIVEYKENRLVLFPSCVSHQALPIQCDDNSRRVSIAQFLLYRTT